MWLRKWMRKEYFCDDFSFVIWHIEWLIYQELLFQIIIKGIIILSLLFLVNYIREIFV